jgi:hypothetical protein
MSTAISSKEGVGHCTAISSTESFHPLKSDPLSQLAKNLPKPSRRLLRAHLLGLTNPKVGTWMQHIQCNQGDLRKVTSRRKTLEICITFRYLMSHYITLQAYTNKWYTLAIHNSISTLWFSICHIISISSMISIVCGKNPPSVPRWPLSLGPQCTRPTILDNPCKLLVPERGYPKIASFLVCVYYIYIWGKNSFWIFVDKVWCFFLISFLVPCALYLQPFGTRTCHFTWYWLHGGMFTFHFARYLL